MLNEKANDPSLRSRVFKNISSLAVEGHSFGRLMLNRQAPRAVWGQRCCWHRILKTAGRGQRGRTAGGSSEERGASRLGLPRTGRLRLSPRPQAPPSPVRIPASIGLFCRSAAHTSLLMLSCIPLSFLSLLFLGACVLVIYELFGEAANTTYALYTCLVCST